LLASMREVLTLQPWISYCKSKSSFYIARLPHVSCLLYFLPRIEAATPKAEAEGLLEFRNLRPAWAT
jgi:hypothetical protein